MRDTIDIFRNNEKAFLIWIYTVELPLSGYELKKECGFLSGNNFYSGRDKGLLDKMEKEGIITRIKDGKTTRIKASFEWMRKGLIGKGMNQVAANKFVDEFDKQWVRSVLFPLEGIPDLEGSYTEGKIWEIWLILRSCLNGEMKKELCIHEVKKIQIRMGEPLLDYFNCALKEIENRSKEEISNLIEAGDAILEGFSKAIVESSEFSNFIESMASLSLAEQDLKMQRIIMGIEREDEKKDISRQKNIKGR